MSGWMINIDLAVDEVVPLLQAMPGAQAGGTPPPAAVVWEDESSIEIWDASPDAGTDISVYDFTERRGWVVFDFLVDRTAANIWMMDDGGLLLSGRGVDPEGLGLDLATNRTPVGVIHRDDDGETSEWSPLKNKRDGILEDTDR